MRSNVQVAIKRYGNNKTISDPSSPPISQRARSKARLFVSRVSAQRNVVNVSYRSFPTYFKRLPPRLNRDVAVPAVARSLLDVLFRTCRADIRRTRSYMLFRPRFRAVLSRHRPFSRQRTKTDESRLCADQLLY